MSNRNKILAVFAVVIIGFLGIAAYGDQIGFEWGNVGINDGTTDYQGTVTDGVPDDFEVKYSRFSINGVKKDASSTGVTSATLRGWCDWDRDNVIDWANEIFRFTESSGVYTSNVEIPISDPVAGFTFTTWVQGYATNYLLVHDSVQITGQPYSDGSAKPAGDLEFTYLDDAFTYDGLMGTTAWDDDSDYNASVTGEVATAKIFAKGGATASRGLTSQVWEQVDYQSVYGHTSDVPYYVKWDQVESNPAEFEDLMKCGTMFSLYVTLQDYDDSNIKGTSNPFDDKISDQTNVYLSIWDELNFNEMFYHSTDASVVEYLIDFEVDSDAAWAMAYGCFLIDVDMDSYLDGDIPYTTAANVVGTAGIDWDVAHL